MINNSFLEVNLIFITIKNFVKINTIFECNIFIYNYSSSADEDQFLSIREKFLKKSTDTKKEKKSKDDEGKKPKKTRKQKERDSDDDEDVDGEGWEVVPKHGAAEKPKMFDKDAEINHELVVKKLREIMAARGKKRTNRKEQIGTYSKKKYFCFESTFHT